MGAIIASIPEFWKKPIPNLFKPSPNFRFPEVFEKGESMQRIDGISAVAVVLIASFAVDRIVTGILFLFSFSKWWRSHFPDPALQPEGEARERAARKSKLVFFFFAALLAIPLLAGFGQIRILAALGFATDPYLDIAITGLILVGGSDRVSELLKLRGPGEEKAEPKPITVTGKLVIEEGAPKTMAAASGR
jgi:hypothetical protein